MFILFKQSNLQIYLKAFKPVIPSRRIKINVKTTLLLKKKLSNLIVGKTSFSGRNNSGSIVVRHRQTKSNKNYILLDLNRVVSTQFAACIDFTFNPNNSCFTALIKYTSGIYSYILAPQGLFYGDLIKTSQYDALYGKDYHIGYCTYLINLSSSSIFFNVGCKSFRGGVYARSAGTYCRIIKGDFEKKIHELKLPSGKFLKVSSYSLVTLGKASNPWHYKEITGKAGTNRLKGFRPTVRGVAMNPVDHPHGGRTKTSSPEVTPWGKIAKKNR